MEQKKKLSFVAHWSTNSISFLTTLDISFCGWKLVVFVHIYHFDKTVTMFKNPGRLKTCQFNASHRILFQFLILCLFLLFHLYLFFWFSVICTIGSLATDTFSTKKNESRKFFFESLDVWLYKLQVNNWAYYMIYQYSSWFLFRKHFKLLTHTQAYTNTNKNSNTHAYKEKTHKHAYTHTY